MRPGAPTSFTGRVSLLAVPTARTRATSERAPDSSYRAGASSASSSLVYVGYAASRVLADDSLAPAVGRAARILDLERALGLDVEARPQPLVPRARRARAWRRPSTTRAPTTCSPSWSSCGCSAGTGRRTDPPGSRWSAATGVALLAYLAMPTAPPRLMDGWTDLLAVHSAAGWWGGEASAPQGLGWLTNQLAAFPSMHAGWALWVALRGRPRLPAALAVAALAWAHAVVTAVVVVGTGNHWVLDVVAGWAVVLIAWQTVVPRRVGRRGSSGGERDQGDPGVGDRSGSPAQEPAGHRRRGAPRHAPRRCVSHLRGARERGSATARRRVAAGRAGRRSSSHLASGRNVAGSPLPRKTGAPAGSPLPREHAARERR